MNTNLDECTHVYFWKIEMEILAMKHAYLIYVVILSININVNEIAFLCDTTMIDHALLK